MRSLSDAQYVTYDKLLVLDSHREVTVECDSEVLGIVTGLSHDMLEECSLMS